MIWVRFFFKTSLFLAIAAAIPHGSADVPAASSVSRHWAFQPVRNPVLPEVRQKAWPQTPVDFFVLARLEENLMIPAGRADRRTLMRRLSFDLTGLPPTPTALKAFLSDNSRDAYGQLVGRLLASPRFGERWGRHWLDVARYADTKGYLAGNQARLFSHSYTYRDYVIRAFNEDLPFDRFLVEQLAADHLPFGEDKRSLAALGFLTLGRRFLNNPHDIIDDRIDVVMRGMMGLTVGCARCHEHKYDPIPMEDYYSLYGVFASSYEPKEKPLIGPSLDSMAQREYLAEQKKRQEELESFRREAYENVRAEVRKRTGDFIWVAHHAKKEGGPDNVAGLADKENLDPVVAGRWFNALELWRGENHPVFSVWFKLQSLGEGNFREEARKLLAGDKLAGADPVILEKFGGKPPAKLRDAAMLLGNTLFNAKKTEPFPWKILHGDGSPAKLSDGDVWRAMATTAKEGIRSRQRKFDELDAEHPGAPQRAMVLLDSPKPLNPRVFLRGNPNRPGQDVPRQFLGVLAQGKRKPFKNGSGRLELARAIVNRDNPLTARVFVNRVWLEFFGQALVDTPSDFGLQAEPPTHPKLLDYLAWRFMEEGWSMKRLIRLIVLSGVYQQGMGVHAEYAQRDPDSRLLWRMNRKRLDLEGMRDALLAVSGRLNEQQGGLSEKIAGRPEVRRRTVYGFINRQNLPGLFRTFDFASPDTSTAKRFSTNIPQQSLFLMNSPFVAEQARALAGRSGVDATSTPDSRIQALYQLAYQRPADLEEMEAAKVFMESSSADESDGLGPWEKLAQVLLVSNELHFVD